MGSITPHVTKTEVPSMQSTLPQVSYSIPLRGQYLPPLEHRVPHKQNFPATADPFPTVTTTVHDEQAKSQPKPPEALTNQKSFLAIYPQVTSQRAISNFTLASHRPDDDEYNHFNNQSWHFYFTLFGFNFDNILLERKFCVERLYDGPAMIRRFMIFATGWDPDPEVLDNARLNSSVSAATLLFCIVLLYITVVPKANIFRKISYLGGQLAVIIILPLSLAFLDYFNQVTLNITTPPSLSCYTGVDWAIAFFIGCLISEFPFTTYMVASCVFLTGIMTSVGYSNKLTFERILTPLLAFLNVIFICLFATFIREKQRRLIFAYENMIEEYFNLDKGFLSSKQDLEDLYQTLEVMYKTASTTSLDDVKVTGSDSNKYSNTKLQQPPPTIPNQLSSCQIHVFKPALRLKFNNSVLETEYTIEVYQSLF
ncbi:hypothetical protein HDU76_000817, partial [Blyttiomyces sp. JEL0837]